MIKMFAYAVLQPFNWCIVLIITAILSKNRSLRKKLLLSALFLFIFFSNGFIANEAMRSFERQTTVPPADVYAVGIVLGGYAGINTHTGQTTFSGAADRMLQTIALYKKGVIKKIMISGGNADPSKTIKEADIINDYLLLIGIPATDIIVERESRNTKENIALSLNILQKLKIKGKVLIITSAWHIPRTRKSVNLHHPEQAIVFYPTNYYSSPDRDFSFNNLIIPSLPAFSTWQLLFKEWAGMLAL